MHVRSASMVLLLATAPLAPAAARNAAARAAASEAMAASAPRLPRISSYFGIRADPLRGIPAIHRGLDLPGPSGTPVRAAASGIVRIAGWGGGLGNMIEVTDADGSRTRYAHLSRIFVRPGVAVAQGDTIALMGSTGRSTGSHLHFEIWVDGRAVDPLIYLSGATRPPAFAERTRAPDPASPHRSAFAQARVAAQVLSGGDTALPAGPRATTQTAP